jgi:hypothetical protein
MKPLLVGLNVLLVLAILGVALFWEPVQDQAPIPGTQAARMVADVLPVAPATQTEQAVTEIRKNPPTY